MRSIHSFIGNNLHWHWN